MTNREAIIKQINEMTDIELALMITGKAYISRDLLIQNGNFKDAIEVEKWLKKKSRLKEGVK